MIIKSIIKNVLPNTKMALIVRSDLKISKGKIASQCSHAAVLCYQKALDSNKSLAKQWSLMGQPKIVLRVDSASELENLYQKARESGMIAQIVRDAGKTQIEPGTKTAIGLLDFNEKVDALVKDLKLL